MKENYGNLDEYSDNCANIDFDTFQMKLKENKRFH